MAHRQGSTWNRYTPSGLQFVDTSRLEQGQREQFPALLNPMVCSKGTIVMVVTQDLSCLLRELL